jgi:hypothetical protein
MPEKAGKKKKKTLVLTLGSPPEMGGKKKQKKTLVLTLGRPSEKGRKKKKENPVINPGHVLTFGHAGKGRKKKKKKPWYGQLAGIGRKRVGSATENAEAGSAGGLKHGTVRLLGSVLPAN